MHIIVDILILSILAFCAWQGYKRGIIGGTLAVAFIIVAIWGGNLIADTHSDEFTTMFRPFVSGYLDRVEVESVEILVPEESRHLSTEDLMRLDPRLEPELASQVFLELGVYETRTEKLVERYFYYRDGIEETTMNQAMTNVLVYAFSFLLLFVIAFLLILIGLTVIYNIIHLSFRLPGFKLVDSIGGGVFGFFQGLLFVLMLTWLLGYASLILPEGLVVRTWVTEFFVRHNPMTWFINL